MATDGKLNNATCAIKALWFNPETASIKELFWEWWVHQVCHLSLMSILQFRYQGKIVDPFVGITAAAGCNVPRHPLWERSLDYVPTGLIRAGFASKGPAQTELWQGEFSANMVDHPLPKGIWRGIYQLKRENKVLINIARVFVVE